MKACLNDFESFGGKIWLNAASEGPLPKAAAVALDEAVRWKSLPYQLDIPKFVKVPVELKDSIGRLIGVEARDVILANSASYGLHILANGLPWAAGDEILLMQNDFPSDILPWLALEKKGVKVRQIVPVSKVIAPRELTRSIGKNSKLFCISSVHTFSGIRPEIAKLAEICKKNGILFVLNLSQSAATEPTDLNRLPVDAAVCAGYKWICGPYGTGFCWIKPEVRDRLDYNNAYWPAVLSEEELKKEDALKFKDLKSARKYDVFGTANFFNFVPFRAAIDYFLGLGLKEVRRYHDELIDAFIGTLDLDKYTLISPPNGPARSSLVFLSLKDPAKNITLHKKLAEDGIYTAIWKGNIRVAPHVYNTIDEMSKTAQYLNKF